MKFKDLCFLLENVENNGLICDILTEGGIGGTHIEGICFLGNIEKYREYNSFLGNDEEYDLDGIIATQSNEQDNRYCLFNGNYNSIIKGFESVVNYENYDEEFFILEREDTSEFKTALKKGFIVRFKYHHSTFPQGGVILQQFAYFKKVTSFLTLEKGLNLYQKEFNLVLK